MIREVKNKEIVLLILMIVLSGIVFALNAGIQGFWSDELFSIGVVREGLSFSELINTYIYEETTNPPLYDIILFFI